jgi:hypothetical protein
MLEPMRDYFRDCISIQARDADRMRASVSFTPDLQGPPEVAHGGGVTAMLFELVRLFQEDREESLRLPQTVRIEATLHREVPLQAPLRAEVKVCDGRWQSRILRGETTLAEAQVQSVEAPLPRLPPETRREWEASQSSPFRVPGYERCLACGLRNPRGAQVRFRYTETLVWERLVPPPHYTTADGSPFPGLLCILGDEIGWWLGALHQGECGLSNRVTVCLGNPVGPGVPLLVLGDRSTVTSSDPKGRIWSSRAAIVTPDWQPVAAVEVQFAGSRAFTKMMLPGFAPGGDLAEVHRAFPRYAGMVSGSPRT